MSFTQSQSDRITVVRVVAVCLILLTHISQEYKTQLSNWADIGVQMFLALSGFLFGQQESVAWAGWARRRLIRLIPSYYIILIATAAAYWLFSGKNIVHAQYLAHFTTLHFLFFQNYPPWGGQFWYITAIVLCYALFPVLHATRRLPANVFLFLNLAALPMLLIVILSKTGGPSLMAPTVYCFVLGFAVARVHRANPPRSLVSGIALLALVLVAADQYGLLNAYWHNPALKRFMDALHPWGRSVAGLACCLVLYLAAPAYLQRSAIVQFLDRYSYEIYLAHPIFIRGTLSLLYLTYSAAWNIVVALVCSFAYAVLVFKLSAMIQQRLELRRVKAVSPSFPPE